MSEVAEPKVYDELNVKSEEIPVMSENLTSFNNIKQELEEEKESLLAEDKGEIVEEKEVPEEKEDKKEIVEEKSDESIKTFLQLFEIFLNKDQNSLVKFNIKLTPEIQKYFLLLCKESPDLFGVFEETLKRIILDDKINTKDIPDILLLVSKVYNTIKKNKGVPTVDPYELIKSLLHVVFVVYLETNKIENSLLLLDLLNIVDSAIDLIKITPIVSKKMGCFFRC